MNEEEALALVRQWARQHDEVIRSGICPRCSAPLNRTEDGRQDGHSKLKSERVWVNYRCSQDPAHYLLDNLEPGAVSADGTR